MFIKEYYEPRYHFKWFLFQVLNYGIGGHYEPHLDYSTATEEEADFSNTIGNRIATVIFYIEDVEAGGCTAFPEVGVTVTPEAVSVCL